MFSFEFNDKRSPADLEKHGIDFVTAQGVWDDPDFIEIQAKSTDEPHSLAIGSIKDNVGAARSAVLPESWTGIKTVWDIRAGLRTVAR
jgi:uncharacterized DUF497 family protein